MFIYESDTFFGWVFFRKKFFGFFWLCLHILGENLFVFCVVGFLCWFTLFCRNFCLTLRLKKGWVAVLVVSV